MKLATLIISVSITLILTGCGTMQTGVRTSGSPHMTNKASGNAVIAVVIRELDTNQDAAKATEIDALKAAITSAVSQAGSANNNGDANLEKAIKPSQKPDDTAKEPEPSPEPTTKPEPVADPDPEEPT